MRLHQLEIAGFKSFVDTVRLDIAGGITAIVGPNGCGKSNLSDAITWVLGEQSAKSLRGTKMEDVIFAGCATRKPVGMAEVALTLQADPSLPVTEDGRLTITRRVFRTGQSQYRINGRTVRLKEIKDLLMDTGLGIRAYSVIEQGKIGMILSGKPQERRKLLEEAAGITRYKARKRVAEVKLEEATSNLLRLDDIISEVERALRSLKRQAGAARRFKAREADYRTFRDQVLRGRWYLLRSDLERLGETLSGHVDRDARLAADLHRDEAALATGREALDALARAVAAHHERQADLTGIIEGRQAFLTGARDTVRDIGERLTRGAQQSEERQGRIAELVRSRGSMDERTAALVAERNEAARVVAEDETQIAAAQKAVETAQGVLESHRQGLLASVGRVNRVRGDLQGQQVDIERRTLRLRYLAEQRERLDKQVAEAETTLETMAAEVTKAETGLGEQEAARAEGRTALDGLLEREAGLTEERRRLEAQRAALGQRQSILRELSAKHAQRRRGLIEALASVGIDAPRFLAETLRSAAGWERTVDHFLGDLADAVLLEPGSDGVSLARKLAEAGASGAFLLPTESPASPATVDDPAVVLPLAEALGLPMELAASLPPAYLVDDPLDAARLASKHPGIAFISRERVWATGGVLRVQSDAAAPGVLTRERELESIGRELPEIEARLGSIAEELRTIVQQRSALAGQVQRTEDRIAELRRQIAVGRARTQDATGRHDKARATRDGVAAEQDEINANLANATARQQTLAEALVAAEAEHQEASRALDDAQTAVEAAKERREALREAGAGRRGRLELLDERLEAHGHEVTRLGHAAAEAEQQLAQWQAEAEQLGSRRTELDAAIQAAEVELQEALETRSVAQENVLAEQRKLDAQREAIDALETNVRALREQRDTVRGQIETLRVDEAGLRQNSEHLAITFRDEFGKLLPGSGLPTTVVVEAVADEDVAVADGSPRLEAIPAEDLAAPESVDEASADAEAVVDADIEPAASEEPSGPRTVELEEVEIEAIDPATLGDLETQMSRAKEILDRIGPVNVLADDEYDEQQERYQFLTEQRTDVANSVKSLKETIREINEASSERFRATFEDVNRTFGETFAKLFRGGEAEMRLLDQDDVLESGIEIMARPPGKRAQNIMLLSGGEKALTAIALLFALFQTKPSPFCILDEVDAPLDDVNVLRFVEVLQDMAKDTQFLIVTHNKLTMEAASTLYGVTMEEKGISKLVSVEMDEVDPIRQAASA